MLRFGLTRFALATLPIAVIQLAEPTTAVAAAERDALSGRWTGSMTLGDAEYPINIWFDGMRATGGRYQIIGVTTDRNPIQNVSLAGDVVTFTLPSRPPQRFRAQLKGDRMQGTISIGGSTETFMVQRVR